MMAGDYVRRSVAEFVGTFALIFIGAGSVIYGDIVGVALAHGLVIAVMVSAVGLISGGFFNPGITIGFLITRRLAPSLGAVYLVVQFAAQQLFADAPGRQPVSPEEQPDRRPGDAGGRSIVRGETGHAERDQREPE